MLGIDSGITEKSGSKNSISEWRTFGMADRQNLGTRKFSEWRTFGIASGPSNGEMQPVANAHRPLASALRTQTNSETVVCGQILDERGWIGTMRKQYSAFIYLFGLRCLF